jgi:hypothetical protein
MPSSTCYYSEKIFYCLEFYSETEIGVYIVRGENIVLFGEVDPNATIALTLISPSELHNKIRDSSKSKSEWEMD